MKILNRNLITLYATQEFLDWFKAVKPNLHRWDLDRINHRPPAYMIDKEDQNCEGFALKENCSVIFENILASHFYIDRTSWPNQMTYDLFSRWFTYRYHEGVYDLSKQVLQASDDF